MQHVRCQKAAPINTMHSSSKIIWVSLTFYYFSLGLAALQTKSVLNPVVWGQKKKKTVGVWSKERFIERVKQGVHAQNNPNSLTDFRGELLQGRWGRKCSVGDHLHHYSLIGWWWGNRVVSRGLTSSVLSLQLVWGLPARGHHAVNFFHLVRVLVSVEQLRNVHQTLSSIWSKSFREGLKILWLLYGWAIV